MQRLSLSWPRTWSRIGPRLLPALLVLTILPACSPALSPLYRDYEIRNTPEAVDGPVQARMRAALQAADWQMTDSDISNVVATEARTLSNWGLYKVTVSLEAVPVGRDYVRVYFHPYREYITGGRSKLPYLSKNLRTALLPELNEALESQGLALIGTPFDESRMAATP